jgi:hypothetical protein
MSDFEKRLTETLTQHASEAPPGPTLAQGARYRHRRRRAARVGVAAAAVLAVAAGVPAVINGLSIHSTSGQPSGRPSGPVVVSLPTSWRWESYHDVEFAVPGSWRWGSLDDWCAGGGPMTPRVDRPGGASLDILCPTSGYGVRIGPPPATPPAGAVVRSITVEGVTVSVVAHSKQEADTIVAFTHKIPGKDFFGCLPRQDVPRLGDMTGSPPTTREDPITLCHYESGVDGANLYSSEQLSRAGSKQVWIALDALRRGTGPDSGPSTCINDPEREAVLIKVGSQQVGWVHYSGCSGHGVDVHGTTFTLSEDLLYWVLPREGFGVDGSVPVPKRLRP